MSQDYATCQGGWRHACLTREEQVCGHRTTGHSVARLGSLQVALATALGHVAAILALGGCACCKASTRRIGALACNLRNKLLLELELRTCSG